MVITLLSFVIFAFTTYEVNATEMVSNECDATVGQSETVVDEAKRNFKPNLEYEFDYDCFSLYTCFTFNLIIRSDNVTMDSFSGSHLCEKTDEDVEQILFHNGTMFFIPSGVGQIFKNVKKLEIGENLGTKRIKRSDFIGLEKLVDLRISKNEITTLDFDTFRDLQQLEVLTIVDNKLTEIHEGTFETNTKLKTINLSRNKIESLPKHLFRNNLLLESVDLGNNSLKTIDESAFEANINLKKLWLYENKLEVIPKGLFRNNLLLEEVSLWNNSLTIIDESTFENNIKLKEVDLQYNRLEVLPRRLFQNNLLLEKVSLNDNFLTLIDESTFKTNINLKVVYLYNNKFESLPENLFQNNSFLEEIDFRSNSLKVIKTDFTSLKNIEKIFFYHNICIDAYYEGYDTEVYDNQFRNLTEFLSLIRAKCSLPNP